MICIRHPSFRLASRTLLFPLALGLLVRLLLLFSAGTVRPTHDEVSYIRGAHQLLSSTGMYNYHWPPGYPGVIAFALWCFGTKGLFYLKLFQVICSAIIGLSIIQISHILFRVRGAFVSGFAWAIYLPLAMYTHHLWPEPLHLTLFVLSMYFLFSYLRVEEPVAHCRLILLTAGVLFGLGLYFKESPTYLAIPLTIYLIYKEPHALSHVVVFPLTIILVLLPLTLRNYHRYDRFVLVGATLYNNVQQGLNARYVNHDYNRRLVKRVHQNDDGSWDFISRNFIAYGPGWNPSNEPNRIDRTRADIKSALSYALNNKKAFLLTRVKKIADFLTPLSFMVRDLSPKIYSGVLASNGVRHVLISIALGSVMILLSVACINLVRLRDDREAFVFFLLIFTYFGLTGLLVSMSRYRIPIVPFLLVLLGGSVVRRPRIGGTLVTCLLSMFCLVVLVALWALNLAEVIEMVSWSWG